MRSARSVLAVLGLLALLIGGACGGKAKAVERPAMVPEGLVPTTVQDGAFQFYESQLPAVKNAFSNGGPNSLAADGRLYELRKGDRLVGALQLSTLVPEVHLDQKAHRDKILRQLLPTSRDEFAVDDTPVWSTVRPEKSVYVWFGKDIFGLLTLKGGSDDKLDPERILTEVVQSCTANDNWKPLYIDDADLA